MTRKTGTRVGNSSGTPPVDARVRAADTTGMPRNRDASTRALTVIAAIAVVLVVGLFAKPLPDEGTPWEFFRGGAAHTDSPLKLTGLVFFTIVLAGMNLMATAARLRVGPLVPILIVAVAALAIVSPNVRRSRLVRAGFGLLLLALLPLAVAGSFVTDNPVGFGFLFAFLTPIGAVLIVAGAILALTATRPDASS